LHGLGGVAGTVAGRPGTPQPEAFVVIQLEERGGFVLIERVRMARLPAIEAAVASQDASLADGDDITGSEGREYIRGARAMVY